jgi:RNA polymerase sigma factor (sigma-70 family)
VASLVKLHSRMPSRTVLLLTRSTAPVHRLLRRLIFGRRQNELMETAQSATAPHEETEHRERHARLCRALDQLPNVYRTVLILCEIESLPSEEVAHLTGISLGTLWVRLHRGRAKLSACLSAEMAP